MNYIHKEKLVYWGLPRTGSRYVFGCLKEAYSFDYRMTHEIGCDPEYDDYRAVCGVRNPYLRALSVWKWMNLVGGDKWHPDSFTDFVRYVAPAQSLPVTSMLGPQIERVDYFIHLEYCEKDLKKIPSFPEHFAFPDNTYQSSYSLSPKEYYADRQVADKIWDIYREDFETFGYTRDSYMIERGSI